MKKTEEHMKGVMFSPESTLFEELGFNYIGPIDGHNIDELIATLSNMRDLKGPQFLHIKTKKGKGYEPAEKDPIGFHGVPKFDPTSANFLNQMPNQPIQKSLAIGYVRWRNKTIN